MPSAIRNFFRALPVEFVASFLASVVLSATLWRSLGSFFPQGRWVLIVVAFVLLLGIGLFTYNQVINSFVRRRKQLRTQDPRLLEITIHDWLFKHDYAVQNAAQPNARFSLTARDPQNRAYTIIQPTDQTGFVGVGARLVVTGSDIPRVDKLPERTIRSLRVEMARVGLEYAGFQRPIRDLTILRVFPSDETLTESSFFQHVRAVMMGLVLLSELLHMSMEETTAG